MERASQLKIALCGLAITIGIALAVSLISWGFNLWSAAELACANETTLKSMEMTKSNGCLEFWFNRYQSLLGNMLTASVAAATLIWIARQLVAADRQVAAANRQAFVAASQVMGELARDLGNEKAQMEALIKKTGDRRGSLLQFGGPIPSPARLVTVEQEASDLKRLWHEACEEFGEIAERLQLPALLAADPAVVTNCDLVSVYCDELSGQCAAMGARWDDHSPLSADQEQRAQRSYENVLQVSRTLADILVDSASHIADERVRAWRRAREFAHSAIAD